MTLFNVTNLQQEFIDKQIGINQDCEYEIYNTYIKKSVNKYKRQFKNLQHNEIEYEALIVLYIAISRYGETRDEKWEKILDGTDKDSINIIFYEFFNYLKYHLYHLNLGDRQLHFTHTEVNNSYFKYDELVRLDGVEGDWIEEDFYKESTEQESGKDIQKLYDWLDGILEFRLNSDQYNLFQDLRLRDMNDTLENFYKDLISDDGERFYKTPKNVKYHNFKSNYYKVVNTMKEVVDELLNGNLANAVKEMKEQGINKTIQNKSQLNSFKIYINPKLVDKFFSNRKTILTRLVTKEDKELLKEKLQEFIYVQELLDRKGNNFLE